MLVKNGWWLLRVGFMEFWNKKFKKGLFFEKKGLNIINLFNFQLKISEAAAWRCSVRRPATLLKKRL